MTKVDSLPLNDKQKAVLKYDLKENPIHTILHGAVRAGKTYIMIWLWLRFVRQYKGKKFIMTGFTLPALKKNVLDDIEEVFGIECRLNKNNEFKLFGNTMCCYGTDDARAFKAMRGMTSHGWFGNEISLSHENSIEEAIKRCSGEGFRMFWDTNPDYPTHPVKTDYIDKSGDTMPDGRIRVKSWHWELFDNAKNSGGYLPSEYVHNLEATTPDGFKKDRAIWGKWVASDGIIFRNFRETMFVDELPPLKTYWAGVDWGYDHYGSILIFGMDHDGGVYLVDGTAERHKEIDWWKEQQNIYKKKYGNMVFYCDSARPEYVRKFNGRNAKKEVLEGINTVSTLMIQKKFFVLRGACKKWEQEIYSYVWRDTGKKEEPDKVNDDAMDAMRYALHSKFSGTQWKPLNL